MTTTINTNLSLQARQSLFSQLLAEAKRLNLKVQWVDSENGNFSVDTISLPSRATYMALEVLAHELVHAMQFLYGMHWSTPAQWQAEADEIKVILAKFYPASSLEYEVPAWILQSKPGFVLGEVKKLTPVSWKR